jgi:hypothetical protein
VESEKQASGREEGVREEGVRSKHLTGKHTHGNTTKNSNEIRFDNNTVCVKLRFYVDENFNLADQSLNR